MKKLLSLLSVLTISGSAIPTTIAANPYQKEKNNLEILNRDKRENYNKPIIIDSYINEIKQNILVIDTDINVRASVGANGTDTQHKFINLENTKEYNIKWEDIKENSDLVSIIGSFEWNNYASPFKESEMFLKKTSLSDQIITYSVSKQITATSGWAKQTGTITAEFNIYKREDGFADLNLKIWTAADSYGAVHGNNTYAKILTIELKK